MAYISNSHGRRKIHLYTNDLLQEAIEEFLQSGAEPGKFASCIIKMATATELLVKEKIEKLCPALVLDNIDDHGLQVAKVFGLSKKLLNPNALDRVSLKTASFPKLLCRAAHFFDLGGSAKHLERLHSIRNGLIHHSEDIDIDEVNLLLITKIFPFLEQFTKDDKALAFRVKSETWRQLKQLAESSSDVIATELSKKLAHHARFAKKLSAARTAVLIAAEPETKRDEQLVETNLLCPACKNESLGAFVDYEVDYDDGLPVGGSSFPSMRCRVCDLDLDQDEIETVITSFGKFFDKDHQKEKADWENALAEPEPDYPDI